MLYGQLRDIVGNIFKEEISTDNAVEAIIKMLETSEDVKLVKDEMTFVVVMRHPRWLNVPFPSFDTINAILHSPSAFSHSLEFEFRAYHDFEDD